jgi:hypothetical protein
MSDIDLGLAFDFIDPADGVARQLRFSRNLAPLAILESSMTPASSSPSSSTFGDPTTDTPSPSAGPTSGSTTSKPHCTAGRPGL